MSYERKTWINNQTKLNASNMNHLEVGLEEASKGIESAAAAASAASASASEAKASAEGALSLATSASAAAEGAEEKAQAAETAVSELSEKLDLKQDALVPGESIKTINGESLLGEGDIKVAAEVETKYEELESASLNDIEEAGVYKIKSASDIPAETSASGTLHVSDLGESHCEQIWYSDSNWARRINEKGSPTPEPGEEYTLIVNGERMISSANAPLTVRLEASQEYDVSGDLRGHIEVYSDSEPAGHTKIRLRGVDIESDSDSGIAYLPEKKRLCVEAYANSSNYVSVSEGAEKDDAAAILSNSDLLLTGAGYLSLKASVAHGLKASELVVSGVPKIRIEAAHDAFHASKILRIAGGEFEIASANDVFSAGSSEDPAKITVEMTICGGSFDILKSTDSIFQSKSTVGNCRIVKGDFRFDSAGVKEMFQEESGGEKVKIYDLCSFSGLSDSQLAEVESRKLVLKDQYGDCKVWYVSDSGEAVYVEELGGEYSLSAGDEVSYNVSGNVSGKRFVTASKKVNVNLKGVYCDEEDESGTTLFDYQNVKSRLQINSTEGYINYIKKNSGTIFHSNSNLALKLKESDATETVPQKISICYLSAPSGTVMNAYCESASEPSRCAIAGDGLCYVTDSKVGVCANDLWLGNEYGDNGEADWGKAYVSLYLKGNETDAELIWKETDEPKKSGYIYAPWYLLGCCVIGGNIIYADSAKRYFEAPSGTVDSLYQNSPIVYTTADVSSYEINSGVTVYDSDFEIAEPTVFEEASEEIAEEGGYGEWVVYAAPDNVYTKEDVDALLAAKEAEISGLTFKLKAATPKKATLAGDSNVLGINIYRYCSDASTADAEAYEGPVYARDGDFGYPCVDGTGQVNFSVAFAEGYDALSISGGTAYKSFKTPYATLKDGIFRITKVTDDLSLNLTALKQSEMESWGATYKLSLPEGYSGSVPSVKEYRTNDAMLEGYSPKAIEFVDGICASRSYSKDTGYPDKSDGDAAQANFEVEWDAVEGYSLTVSASPKSYKNLKVDGSRYQITKISGDLEIEISVSPTAA